MKTLLVYVLGGLVFAAVLLVGFFIFGIRPTFAEVVLVCIAGGAAEITREAVR